MKPTSQDVCARIRRLAMEKGIGRTELAARAGVSGVLVYKVMHGKANLRDATIGKFAKALVVSIDDLMFLRDGVKVDGAMSESRASVRSSTAPGMVKDGVAYPTREERLAIRIPEEHNVRSAVRCIAEQLDIPEERVMAAIADLMRDAGKSKTLK
jgi:transcriptional regulator with XRE-family HTH domain